MNFAGRKPLPDPIGKGQTTYVGAEEQIKDCTDPFREAPICGRYTLLASYRVHSPEVSGRSLFNKPESVPATAWSERVQTHICSSADSRHTPGLY